MTPDLNLDFDFENEKQFHRIGVIRKAFSSDEFFCDSTVISLFTNATSQNRDETSYHGFGLMPATTSFSNEIINKS